MIRIPPGPPAGPAPLPVSVVTDLPFATTGTRTSLRANLHLPRGAGAPVPVIIWVHGGGWRFGNRTLGPDLSRRFAERGFAMVAVDYRLSDRATFPAQLEDLKTAIRWVRSLAPTYGLDAGRIGLWGSSAGGHLSALAALTTHGEFERPDGRYPASPSHVQAVVAGYPPVDFLQIDAHRPPGGTRSADPESLLLPRMDMRSADADSFESLLLGAPIETCADRVRLASPITYVRAGAPPFLILHGLADTTIPFHQSVLLYEALAAHDNDATLCLIEGLGHGFLHRTHLDDAPARQMIIRRHAPGLDEQVEEIAQPIFPLIEAFFRNRLSGADPHDR